MVFVCENNGFAITSAAEAMTPGGIAPRAASFGLAAQSVDGMDVRTVHSAAAEAVERARAGGGPSFIECRTVRYSVHNISAGPRPTDHRGDAFLAEARRRDPIERLAGELTREARWTGADRARIDEAVEQILVAAIEFARGSGRPDPSTALDFMYATTYPDFPARGWEA